MNELSNLIIPRVNINSQNSIQDAINLAETFKFDSFILFSSDEVKFEKKKPFPLSRMADLKKELNKVIPNFYFYIDAERGFGHRCSEGFLWEDDFDSVDSNSLLNIFNKINSELKENGIFCNLAPVVDINPKNEKILNNRTLGSSVNSIIKNVRIFIDSCSNNLIHPCLKHFPGHGALEGDTHINLSVSTENLKNLNELHLATFRPFLNQTPLVMVNHGWYKSFDEEILPASLSKNIISSLLKDQYNFKGLVIADSIRMKALSDNYEESYILESFFNAGGDLLLDPYDPAECLRQLKLIYENNHKSFDKKIHKVLKLKKSGSYE